jgi:hypothetical protein
LKREIEIEQFTVLIEGGINLTESEAVEMVDLLGCNGIEAIPIIMSFHLNGFGVEVPASPKIPAEQVIATYAFGGRRAASSWGTSSIRTTERYLGSEHAGVSALCSTSPLLLGVNFLREFRIPPHGEDNRTAQVAV